MPLKCSVVNNFNSLNVHLTSPHSVQMIKNEWLTINRLNCTKSKIGNFGYNYDISVIRVVTAIIKIMKA